MTPRRRLLAVLLALAIAAIGVVWWSTRSRSADDPASDDDPAVVDASKAPPVLERAPTPAPQPKQSLDDGAPRPAVSSLDEPKPGSSIHVRGRARREHGPLPDDAIVYVAVRVRNEQRYVERAQVARFEEFEFEIVPPEGEGPRAIDVGLWATGCRRVEEHHYVLPGATIEQDLVVPDDVHLRGVVVDDDGRPVPDVEFVIVEGGSATMFSVEDPPNPRTDAKKGGWDTSVVASARSDARGGFDVAGLEAGHAYAPASSDGRWLLDFDEPKMVVAPADGVRFVARTAFRLLVDVAPANPKDDPIERWDYPTIYFESPATGSWSSSSRPSEPRIIRGAVKAAHRQGFKGTVRADTRMHRPKTVDLSFGPGAWEQRVRVEIERLSASEIGTVALFGDLLDADGKPIPLDLTDTRRISERSTIGEGVRTVARDDGAFVGEMATGSHEATIRTRTLFAELLVWKGTIDVTGGRETAFHVPWPPHGRVRIRVEPKPGTRLGTGTLSLAVGTGDSHASARWSGMPTLDASGAAVFVVPAAAAGEGEAKWTEGLVVRTAKFVIPAGGDVDVVFAP